MKSIELLDIFEEEVKNNPNDSWSYFYLATLYEMAGGMYDARNACRKAKELSNKGRTLRPMVDFIERQLQKNRDFPKLEVPS